MKQALRMASVLLVLAGACFGGITVSSPATGSSVSSPVQITASATSTKPVTYMKVYVDSAGAYSTYSSSINTKVSMSSGTHSVVVKAWDSSGNVQSASRSVTVSGGTVDPATPPPTGTGAKTFSDLEQGTNWVGSSSVAIGAGGGTTTDYHLWRGISSPSMDGTASQFHLGGSQPYTNAIWWRKVVQNTTATNFVYDMYLYMKDPAASQALEFSANQTVNNRRYKFSTQCAFNSGVWRIYSPFSKSWIATSATCKRLSAYQWHHITLEYKRANGKANFISVTVDGVKQYLNKSLDTYYVNDNWIYVHFQADGNRYQTDYSTWIDKMKLTVW
jgi:hypothetical protein